MREAYQLRRLLGRERTRPRQVVLLGTRSKADGNLAGIDTVDGVALVTTAEQWRQGNGILVTTVRSFKDLEADVVIVYDVDGLVGCLRRPIFTWPARGYGMG